jgi:hypothetical protein
MQKPTVLNQSSALMKYITRRRTSAFERKFWCSGLIWDIKCAFYYYRAVSEL